MRVALLSGGILRGRQRARGHGVRGDLSPGTDPQHPLGRKPAGEQGVARLVCSMIDSLFGSLGGYVWFGGTVYPGWVNKLFPNIDINRRVNQILISKHGRESDKTKHTAVKVQNGHTEPPSPATCTEAIETAHRRPSVCCTMHAAVAAEVFPHENHRSVGPRHA